MREGCQLHYPDKHVCLIVGFIIPRASCSFVPSIFLPGVSFALTNGHIAVDLKDLLWVEHW
ncbi:hypothetical protein BJX76DRAFT_336691 [Aspergillus varians]